MQTCVQPRSKLQQNVSQEPGEDLKKNLNAAVSTYLVKTKINCIKVCKWRNSRRDKEEKIYFISELYSITNFLDHTTYLPVSLLELPSRGSLCISHLGSVICGTENLPRDHPLDGKI
jgi:hypothetical protein